MHDNGVGIPANKLGEVFKPFVSTKGSKGTGLGLAVSRKILREHGGDILAQSQPGKGMIVFGSGSIVSQLTQHGLIDEYQLAVCPILLGSGRPLFSDVTKSLRLDLLEAKAYPSGDVLLRYARSK